MASTADSPASSSLQPGHRRRELGLIFLIVFLDLLGASLLVPVAPYLVREYRTDALAVGILNLSYSAAQFAASPILGVLSDRFGRRPVLLLSILGSAIGYFLFGTAQSLGMLFFSRVVDGISGGNISTAQAYIADVSAPQDRAKNFGLIGAAFGLGFILGPALGGVLSHISLQAPAFAAGLLSLATLGLCYFFLPESHPVEKRTEHRLSLSNLNPIAQIARALVRPELRILLLCTFVLNFAFSALTTNFAVYTMVRFGLGPAENALLFSWLGLLAALVQGVMARRVLKGNNEGWWAQFSIFLLVIGFLMVAYAPTVPWLYASMLVTSIGGMSGPALTSLLSRRVSGAEQGSVLGTMQSLNSLTRVLGPVYAGAVFDVISPEAPYWTGALILSFSLFLAWRGVRGVPHPDAAH